MVVLSLINPAVQSYIVYSAILALKVLALGFLTGAVRISKGVYANPEDVTAFGGKLEFDDPDVERFRRAHLNDLENIPAFWLLGALYLTTGPVAAWATMQFRIYTVFRIMHTVVYAIMPRAQPARAIGYFIPTLISFYMFTQIILFYATAL